MDHNALGQFVIVGGVGIMLLIVTLFSTAAGLAIVSVLFTISGAMIWAVAKGGIHEATGSILLVGAAICAGFAGISRDMRKRDRERPSP